MKIIRKILIVLLSVAVCFIGAKSVQAAYGLDAFKGFSNLKNGSCSRR